MRNDALAAIPPPKIIIPVAIRMLEKFGKDITQCPKCKKGKLVLVAIIYLSSIKIGKQKLVDTYATPQPEEQNKASP